MAAVLEGLDRVAWGRLRHAYGPARDVPDQLRALRSPDPEQRKRAMWSLYGNIFHQGTRYEASAPAVPFLLELLADPATPDRHELLGLLTSIAIGYDETWLPAGMRIAEFRAWAADRGEASFALAAYDAVRAGVGLFATVATDPDPALRTAAGYAMAWFPEEAATSAPALARLAGDTDELVAATAIVALGLIGRDRPDDIGTDPRPLVRLAGALTHVRVRGSDAAAGAVEELLGWTRRADTKREGFPFLHGDVGGYAAQALRKAGAAHDEAAFDALLERIPLVSGLEALPVVGEALRRAFPVGLPAGTPFRALSTQQQRLVRALADSPSTWQWGDMQFGNFSSLVGEYGLPNSADALRRYADA
jgi:HEAT repeat protein